MWLLQEYLWYISDNIKCLDQILPSSWHWSYGGTNYIFTQGDLLHLPSKSAFTSRNIKESKQRNKEEQQGTGRSYEALWLRPQSRKMPSAWQSAEEGLHKENDWKQRYSRGELLRWWKCHCCLAPDHACFLQGDPNKWCFCRCHFQGVGDVGCVRNVTLGHLSVHNNFVNMVQLFTNLVRIELSHCGLKSIDGIASCNGLQGN